MIGAAVLSALLLGLALFMVMSDKPDADASRPQSVAINGSMLIVMKHVGEIAKQPVGVTSVAIAADDKSVTTGLSDGGLVVWGTARGELVRRLVGHAGAVNGVAFWPDGKLVSGGADGTIRLWNVATGKQSARCDVTGGAITCVSAYPFGPYVLAGCSDRTLRLCDPSGSRELRRFEGHSAAVTSVAFAPDGRSILSGDAEGNVLSWPVTESAPQAKLSDGTAAVRGVAFTSDGVLGLSAAEDGRLRVWDLQQRKLKESFRGPFDEETALTSLARSPGGTLAITGGSDQRLHLWQVLSSVERGHVGASERLHEQMLTGCGLSPNGVYAYSGGAEGTLQAWVLLAPTEMEIELAKGAFERFRQEAELRKPFAEQMQRGQTAAQSGRLEEARQAFRRAQESLPPETLESQLAEAAMKELDTGASRQRDDYVRHMEKGKQALDAGDENLARKEFLSAKSIAPQRPEADDGLAQIERSRELKMLLGTAKSKPEMKFDFQPTGDDLLKQGTDFAFLFDEDELAKSQQNISALQFLRHELPQPEKGLTSSPLVWTVVVTTTKPIPEPNLKVRLRLQDAEFRRVFAEQDYVLQQGTQVQNIAGRAQAPEGGWTSGRYAFRYFLVTPSSERELGVPRRFSIGLLKWTKQSIRVAAPDVQKSDNYTIRTGFPVIVDEPYRIDASGDIRPVSPALFRSIAGREGVGSCGPEGIFPVPGSREQNKYMGVASDLPFAALLFKMDAEQSTPWSRYQHRLSRNLSLRSGEVSLSINSVTGTRQTSRSNEKFKPVSKSSPMYWQDNGEFQVILYRGQFVFPVSLSRDQKLHLLKPFLK